MRRVASLMWLAVPLLFAGCGDDSPSGGSEVDWWIELDGQAPGDHLVHMVVDFGPLPETSESPAASELEASGRLVWDDVEVALCSVKSRETAGQGQPAGVGDIFAITEGCGDDPTAMQDAFDEFGLPVEGCVEAAFGGDSYVYCAPLPVEQNP